MGMERGQGPVPHHSLNSDKKFGLDSLGQRLKMCFSVIFLCSMLFYFCLCHPMFKNRDISLKTPGFFQTYLGNSPQKSAFVLGKQLVEAE